ncbi:MAG: hypothetical protein ACC645_07345 [Pirellulales bacterium]
MSQLDSRLANGGGAGYGDKPRANAYTMLLIVALLALLVGCLFLVLEVKFQKQGEGFFSPVRPVVLRAESGPRESRWANTIVSRGRCGEARHGALRVALPRPSAVSNLSDAT